MPKHSAQRSMVPHRQIPNSGTRAVPKLNRASPAVHMRPEFFSALLDTVPGAKSNGSGSQSFHTSRSALFTEGQPASGVFIIESGAVKLSMCSGRGRSLILGFFGPQSVLGLPAAILGFPHESTAEAVKPVTAQFLSRERLLQHIGSGANGLRAAEAVSRILYSTLREMETLWLSDSVKQKLARFLLSLCPPRYASCTPLRLPLDLTHEDIAQRIGVSRESVTRFLSRFKKQGIVDLSQSVLTVTDISALQRIADFSGDAPLSVQTICSR